MNIRIKKIVNDDIEWVEKNIKKLINKKKSKKRIIKMHLLINKLGVNGSTNVVIIVSFVLNELFFVINSE